MPRQIRELAIKLSIGLLLFAASMELLAKQFGLPHVPTVIAGIMILWDEGTLQHDVLVSSSRWLMGWVIGGGVGVVLGLVTGRSKRASMTIEGLLILFRAIPFISLVPLILRVFGLAETGKIFLVAWASVGICWVVVHKAAKGIPKQLVWRAKSLGASWGKWVFRVLIPASREGIHSGLRASLSLGLIVIAVAELSGVYERSGGSWWSEGLGYRLFRSLDEARDDLMMASIMAFAMLGIVMDLTFLGGSKLVSELSFYLQRRRAAKHMVLAKKAHKAAVITSEGAVQLEVDRITAGYDGNRIINELSFRVPAGSTTSVVGPSGCGKTTLIRAVGSFRDETFSLSGLISAGDSIMNKPGPWVGVVLQDAPVFDHMTVWDNMIFGSRFRKISDDAIRSAWTLLFEFGLEGLARQRAGTLSGGQRQRLALAMVLANRPSVLLLDEPFGALDAITRRQLQHFYWLHVHGTVTAIFVTHDIEEALLIGDSVRVGVFPNSKVINVDKNGLSPHEWELSENFGRMRVKVIEALEESLTKP